MPLCFRVQLLETKFLMTIKFCHRRFSIWAMFNLPTQNREVFLVRFRSSRDLAHPNPIHAVQKTDVHDDVIKWKHFPRNWPFVRGIHRSPVNSPHKGHWRGALMFSSICPRINSWVNNGEAGELGRNRAHYDVTVIQCNVGHLFLMPIVTRDYASSWLQITIIPWTLRVLIQG